VNDRAPPRAIDVDRDDALTVTWEDGTTTRLGLEALRQGCPCAACRDRRDRGLAVWPVAASPRPLRIVDAHLVGNWGLGVTWNDGHNTGIYSWPLLHGD